MIRHVHRLEYALKTCEEKLRELGGRPDDESKPALDVVLNNEIYIDALVHHLKHKHASQIVSFWLSIEAFSVAIRYEEEDAGEISAESMERHVREARVLYDTYFGINATEALPISDAARDALYRKVVSGNCNSDTFKSAQAQMYSVIQTRWDFRSRVGMCFLNALCVCMYVCVCGGEK